MAPTSEELRPSSNFNAPNLVVILLATMVMFTHLGAPRLWDRDEPRNAGCAAEMLDRQDWVTPVFNGELRSHKPVLLYWLMMPGYALFGENEWTARFPSALLAVGTCWLTMFMGRRLFGAEVGRLAAMVLCSTMMFVVAGRAATPDSTLIFFATAATAVFVAFAFPPINRKGDTQLEHRGALPYFAALGMYALMGVAVLGKGPVGLILPTAVIGMFLLLQRLPAAAGRLGEHGSEGAGKDAGSGDAERKRSWRSRLYDLARCFHPWHFLKTCWWMRPVTAITVALAVALPWYIWVGIRTDGAWLEGFFLEHNVGRAMRTMESHGGGVWYYPVALLAGFFPWSIFAGPTLMAASRCQRSSQDRRAVVFCACWVGVYVGLFTIARTKLPSYITPCYPAVALLTAWQLRRWQQGAIHLSQRWLIAGMMILGVVGVGMSIGLPIAAAKLLPGEQWLGLGGLIPLVGAWLCWRHVRADRRGPMVRAFATCAFALVMVSFAWLSQHVSKHQQFDRLLTAIAAHSDSPRIATYECMEPSWVFYSRDATRKIERVWFAEEQSPESLAAERDRPRWSPDPRRQDFEAFVEQGDGFIITTQWQYDRIRELLPSDMAIIARTPLFLKPTDLVVLSCVPAETKAGRQLLAGQ